MKTFPQQCRKKSNSSRHVVPNIGWHWNRNLTGVAHISSPIRLLGISANNCSPTGITLVAAAAKDCRLIATSLATLTPRPSFNSVDLPFYIYLSGHYTIRNSEYFLAYAQNSKGKNSFHHTGRGAVEASTSFHSSLPLYLPPPPCSVLSETMRDNMQYHLLNIATLPSSWFNALH